MGGQAGRYFLTGWLFTTLVGGWLLPTGPAAAPVPARYAIPGYGVTLTAVAVNPETGRVYLVDAYNNDLIVLDGADHRELIRVQIGERPAGGAVKPKYVAVDPAADLVYVTNPEDSTLRVVDGGTNSQTAAVTVAYSPGAVAVNPVTHRVYVVTAYGVDVVEGTSHTVVETIPLYAGPVEVAVNPVTNRVYTVVGGSNRSLVVASGTTNEVLAEVDLGITSHRVAVNQVANRVFVANNANGELFAVNGATNRLAATFPTGSCPEGIAVDPLANRVYLALNSDHDLQILDGARGTLLATVPVDLPSRDVAANPALDRAYLVQYPNYLVVVQDDAAPHDAPPEILSVSLGRKSFPSTGGRTTIAATVEDDRGVATVWALVNNATRVTLRHRSGSTYTRLWTVPRNAGAAAKKYRIDVYAADTAGNQSGPLRAGIVTVRGRRR
jgi:YVTN family beta-propeller protein